MKSNSRARRGALFAALGLLPAACVRPASPPAAPNATAAVATAAPPSSGARFAGTWRLVIDGSGSAPGAELRLTDRGAVPPGVVIVVGRRGYTRGGVLTGTTALSEVPGGPGALSSEVLAVATRGDSVAVAVLGAAPAADGRGRAESGVALFGQLAGDSIVGFWQWASDSVSRRRGVFVIRRP